METRSPVIFCINCMRVKQFSNWLPYKVVKSILEPQKHRWYRAFWICPDCERILECLAKKGAV